MFGAVGVNLGHPVYSLGRHWTPSVTTVKDWSTSSKRSRKHTQDGIADELGGVRGVNRTSR